MARAMPNLAGAFDQAAKTSLSFAAKLEEIQAHLTGHPSVKRLTTSQLEIAYEICYLNVFCKWEDVLERSFLRLLCGYTCPSGQAVLIGGSYSRTLADARSRVLAGRDYLLWHSATKVIARSKSYFANGPHELVLGSHESRLEAFGAIRHHIAHEQEHARKQFDHSTMLLAGRRFRGSKAGKFLRTKTTGASGLPVRWLERIGVELVAVAKQLTA